MRQEIYHLAPLQGPNPYVALCGRDDPCWFYTEPDDFRRMPVHKCRRCVAELETGIVDVLEVGLTALAVLSCKAVMEFLAA